MALLCQPGEPRVRGSHESHCYYGLLSNWDRADVASSSLSTRESLEATTKGCHLAVVPQPRSIMVT